MRPALRRPSKAEGLLVAALVTLYPMVDANGFTPVELLVGNGSIGNYVTTTPEHLVTYNQATESAKESPAEALERDVGGFGSKRLSGPHDPAKADRLGR